MTPQSSRAHGPAYLTTASMLLLVAIEVFGVALAGGWALAGLFELGSLVGYGLMAAFSLLAAWLMLQLWRKATALDAPR